MKVTGVANPQSHQKHKCHSRPPSVGRTTEGGSLGWSIPAGHDVLNGFTACRLQNNTGDCSIQPTPCSGVFSRVTQPALRPFNARPAFQVGLHCFLPGTLVSPLVFCCLRSSLAWRSPPLAVDASLNVSAVGPRFDHSTGHIYICSQVSQFSCHRNLQLTHRPSMLTLHFLHRQLPHCPIL